MSAEDCLEQIIRRHRIQAIAWDVDGTLVTKNHGLRSCRGPFEQQVNDASRLQRLLSRLGHVQHVVMSRNYNFNKDTCYHAEVCAFGFDVSVPDLYRSTRAKVVQDKATLLIDDTEEECVRGLKEGCVAAICIKGNKDVFAALDSGAFQMFTN